MMFFISFLSIYIFKWHVVIIITRHWIGKVGYFLKYFFITRKWQTNTTKLIATLFNFKEVVTFLTAVVIKFIKFRLYKTVIKLIFILHKIFICFNINKFK